MTDALIPKSDFVGLEGVAHFATGGEGPMLKSHLDAFEQFCLDKGRGELARGIQHAVLDAARAQCATLIQAPAEDITFLSSASEGINLLRYALDWRAGDNVVVADVEFPSDVLPWTSLAKSGIEIRVVKHRNWVIDEQDVLAQVDARTRVVAISQVSMFTGQHIDVPTLSAGVREAGALLLLDVTHAAGVVPVRAQYADVLVSSCYKWMLGTHGTALFYLNRDRLADLAPPFLGWASITSGGGWQSPLEYTLPDTADRFLPANPSYISLYMLNNALQRLSALGENTVAAHSRALSGDIRAALVSHGVEMMTPEAEQMRAGNVSFVIDNIKHFRDAMAEHNVLVWGAYGQVGRVRISAHVHNNSDDVERLLAAMRGYFESYPARAR